MARQLPAVAGLVKHQVYLGSTTTPPPAHANDALLTLWTWKNTGSPVPAGRITDEQAALFTGWFPNLKGNLSSRNHDAIVRLRSWDYGLDPATRYAYADFAPIAGTEGNVFSLPRSGQYTDRTWIVALRVLPVGSNQRSRLNGRISFPVHGLDGGGGTLPAAADLVGLFDDLRVNRLNGSGAKGVWSVVSWRHAKTVRTPPLVTAVDHVIVQRYGTQRRRDARQGRYATGA